MKVVIGTTLTTYAMLDPQRAFLWRAWLLHAEEMLRRAEDEGYELRFFAAIQHDSRHEGHGVFGPLVDRLSELGGAYWYYSLDDGRTEITQANRGRHITMGQNLVSEYATANGADWLLHMASDCEPPPDVVGKLLEPNHLLIAAECPTYCMSRSGRDKIDFVREVGQPVIPIEQGPMTAVCVLIGRPLFKRIKWRWDGDLGMTDDPSFSYDALKLFNVPTWTRMDCVAIHHPQAIGPIETRFPGLDMGVQS